MINRKLEMEHHIRTVVVEEAEVVVVVVVEEAVVKEIYVAVVRRIACTMEHVV